MQDLEFSGPKTDPAVYIGIDVSKRMLDVYIHPTGERLRVSNDASGHKQLTQRCLTKAAKLVIVEATGRYHRAVHRALHASGQPVSVINPLRARRFADALGQLAKTDAIDARLLALYGARMQPRASTPSALAMEELRGLVGAWRTAKADRVALSNQLEETESRFVRTRLSRRLRQLDAQIIDFGRAIKAQIKADPALDRTMAIITSVPGLGFVNAATLLAELPELGRCRDKQIAALVGVAPMCRQSGNWRGKASIRGGRKTVRNTLYMAAVSAAKWNPGLKVFYQRLIENGKPAKVALTAVMRKLIILTNTLIKENRKWSITPP